MPIVFLPFGGRNRRDRSIESLTARDRLNGEKTVEQNGRKTNGQFAKGNGGGPGRPPRDVEADYLTTLIATVTADRWRRIVARAADDAEAGDHRTREWLGKYLVGDKAAVAISMHTETPMRVVELDDWYGNADRLEDSA